jgi:hypothetical protein
MAEIASAAKAPAARTVIYTMDFDLDMVQHALAQAGGNEQRAINLILNGEVDDASIGPTSADSVAAPDAGFSGSAFGFGAAAPAVGPSASQPSIAMTYTNHFIGKRVLFSFDADGNPLTPSEQRVQIKRSLELIKAAAWFLSRRSPGIKRHREEPPPPLGYMLTEFSPCAPVRVMCGCVATTCRRLATAPACVHVVYKTTWRWTGWIMERVTRGRVSSVQVRLQRHA